MFTKVCKNCGNDFSGTELSAPCPRCGARHFETAFTHPMTIRGGGSVELPVYSTDPTQVQFKTSGAASVSFGGETHSYRFRSFKKIKRKAGKNWVQVSMRRDKRGLDVIFGHRDRGAQHSHYGYTARASTLYARNEADTRLVRRLLFSLKDGVVQPLRDQIDDPGTGMSAFLRFVLDRDEVILVDVEFLPTRPAS